VKLIMIGGKKHTGKGSMARHIKACYNFKCKETPKAAVLSVADPVKHNAYALGWDGTKVGKMRKMLQIIGTEVGRNQVNRVIWVEMLATSIHVLKLAQPGLEAVIVPDIRFDSEVEFLIARMIPGVSSTSVIRLKRETGLEVDNHPSENSFTSKYVTYDIGISLDFASESAYDIAKWYNMRLKGLDLIPQAFPLNKLLGKTNENLIRYPSAIIPIRDYFVY